MREKATRAFHWLREYRAHVCIALLLAAGLMWMKRSEMKIVPEATLSPRDVTVEYVGPLEAIVSRSGIHRGSTHLNAGFGIGIKNDVDRDDILRRLRPVIYVPFARILDVGQAQLAAIEEAGPVIRIGLFQGEIITAHSASIQVLTYQQYVVKVEKSRSAWLMACLFMALTSVALFVATYRRKLPMGVA